MAAAAPSPLASSVEKTNGAKLSRLLIDGGTTVLRNHFDRYHPPAHLATNLNSHYCTLNSLLRDGYLKRPQWNKLFPRRGVPDSKSFDISLLFILLTNICGLSPPHWGEWHRKPPDRDTSFEAKIARIKYFRNELYGHVTTTGIATPKFTTMWREISAALRGLGLHQTEIDRLKAERGGEQDYIDVLLEWADSEEDIKSQLEDLRQSLTKVQETSEELHKIQLEDRKILQDSKVKTEEVHKAHTKLQQTVGEVRKTQLEDSKTLHDSKVKLEEAHQKQTKTQQTVDEVRQTQIEDRLKLDEVQQVQTKTQRTVDEVHKTQLEDSKTLQDGKVKLDKVHQLQTKTQQTVGEVRQTQIEDHEILQDSTLKLEEVHQVQTKTQQTVDEVHKTQIEDCWKLEEVLQIEKTTHHVVTESRQSQLEDSKVIQDTKSKVEDVSERLESFKQIFEQKVEDLEGQRVKNKEDEILKKLAKIDAMKDVRRHTESYVEGTRLPIFTEVESWLDDRSSPNRVMVISGRPGMGKSVISAKMCQKMLETGRLAGSHFCQHDRARKRNPKVMLQSLASHLADSLPDYKKALVEKMTRNLGVEINDMEVKDLFELLFEEPLTSLNDPGLTFLMVIDGIDESEHQGRNELLDVIANYFAKLPLWIRFLVTTRPEIKIADRLNCLHPLELKPDNEENLNDINVCFEKQLSRELQTEHRESILQALVEKSEGVMLYAHYLVDFIKEKVPLLTPELLDSTIPSGISSVYQSYFERLETDLRKVLEITKDPKGQFKIRFMKFLSAVAAAREPLPVDFASKLLLSDTCELPSAVQLEVNAAISCVSALLPVQDDRIHFFHKSVKDWLIEKSNYRQYHFSVTEKEGHGVLSKLCIDELDDVKRKGVDGAQFSDTAKYALQHGVQHMLQLDEDARVCSHEDVVKKYCLDLEVVYAKLCVGVTASDDILCVQKQEGVNALLEEWQTAIGTLLCLLRKHVSTLTENPHAIFQTLLNEGGPELSSEALNLLETRYSEIPYMEFVDKNDLEVLVQSKFRCSAKVVCFDVSPQLDYMACECQDGTIQLWSLHTGKQLWKRHVTVTKDYYSVWDFDGFPREDIPYRTGPSSNFMTFYRSVVFHPTKDLVLPGILSHAFTTGGDMKPLFPSSKCRFSVCSISAGKTKMLTDCPDNANSIFMWSLEDGSEIKQFPRKEAILSFAWSHDERLLAISHPSGLICLVDVMDGFNILAKTTAPWGCGMIQFSPDYQFLYCLHSVKSCSWLCNFEMFRIRLNVGNDCKFSSDVLPEEDYFPWEFDSCSKTGYLLGDPFCSPSKSSSSWEPELVFVLNKQSVLRVPHCSTVVEMLHPDELTKERNRPVARKVVFSLNGDILYVFTGQDATPSTLIAWDVSSEKSKAEISIDCSFLVAGRTGVLLGTSTGTLELWNFELSQCIRSWDDLKGIRRAIPISEERVAFEVSGREVVILDTASGDCVSTITILGEFVACDSKCHVISIERNGKLQMQYGEHVLWKISQPFDAIRFFRCNTFSPTDQYCVVGGQPESGYGGDALYVLDAESGRTLHMLCTASYSWFDCKFVSNEECVISNDDESRGFCLQLYNVKSGDLLSEITVESPVCSLAACPCKRLVAIGFEDSKHSFNILKVKLPQNKSSRKNKRDRIKLQE